MCCHDYRISVFGHQIVIKWSWSKIQIQTLKCSFNIDRAPRHINPHYFCKNWPIWTCYLILSRPSQTSSKLNSKLKSGLFMEWKKFLSTTIPFGKLLIFLTKIGNFWMHDIWSDHTKKTSRDVFLVWINYSWDGSHPLQWASFWDVVYDKTRKWLNAACIFTWYLHRMKHNKITPLVWYKCNIAWVGIT